MQFCELVINETVSATLFDSMEKFQVFDALISQAAEKFITDFLKFFKISINLTLSWKNTTLFINLYDIYAWKILNEQYDETQTIE